MITAHRVQAFLLRHFYEIRTSIDRKADVIFYPLIDILIFGFLSAYIDSSGGRGSLAGAILGALILWTLVYNIARDISFCLLEDAWSRNLYNLYSTPLRISEIIIGTLILSVLKALITVSLLVGLAYTLFDFNFTSFGPTIAFYVFNIFVFGWAFGFATSALILRFGQKVQSVSWSLMLVLYPVSGVFYPLAVLPLPLAAVAKIFPLAHIFEGLRVLILTRQTPSPESFVIIAVLSMVYLALGIWFFTLGFAHAKNRGWFIHPS